MSFSSARERFAAWTFGAAAAISIILLLCIFGFLAYFSAPIIRSDALSNLLSWTWAPASGQYGILAMVSGTLLLAFSALLLALLLGIAVLSLAHGLAPRPIGRVLLGLVHFMTSVPTVVWAFLSVFLLVPLIREASGASGFSWVAATITLAIVIVPTIVLVLSSQLQQIPTSLRLTGCALGFNRAQYLIHLAYPYIRQGFFAAIVLGAGRALGDTIVALMLSGNSPLVPTSPLDSMRTLTAHIALVLATDSQSLAYASLFASGLLLCIAALILNLGLFWARRRGR